MMQAFERHFDALQSTILDHEYDVRTTANCISGQELALFRCEECLVLLHCAGPAFLTATSTFHFTMYSSGTTLTLFGLAWQNSALWSSLDMTWSAVRMGPSIQMANRLLLYTPMEFIPYISTFAAVMMLLMIYSSLHQLASFQPQRTNQRPYSPLQHSRTFMRTLWLWKNQHMTISLR